MREMIQDIYPHIYHNEYVLQQPKDTDMVLLFEKDEVLLKENTKEMFSYGELKTYYLDAEYRYLFRIDETNFYYIRIKNFTGLSNVARYGRNVFRTYQPRHLAFAGITAFQLYQWYESHAFCGRCGRKLVPDLKERALRCEACGEIIYPTISPAVIVGIIDKKNDRILFTKYAGRDYKKYALVAGFAEIGETLEDTVRREVKEEVGLSVKNIRYYKNQPWSFTGTLLVGFFAELDGEADITLEEDELKEATWFERKNMPPTENDISLTAEMMEAFRAGKENL